MSEKIQIVLESIQIAQPCRADWDAMTGDERTRFCGSCQKNVYNLSQLSREQAENLILEKEGNLCIQLHRRADGTVITADCPVGISATRRPFQWLLAGFAALFASGMAVAGQKPAPKIIYVPKPTPIPAKKTKKAPKVRPKVKSKTTERSVVVMGSYVLVPQPAATAAPPRVIMGRVRAMPTPTPTGTPEPPTTLSKE